jgi:hypothetical protein
VAHPPLPWKLNIDGAMISTVQLVDVDLVRPALPEGFEVVSVLPGKTVGGVYLARYGPGSTVEYNEFGIFPAYVRYGRRSGLWVAMLYVDNTDSLNLARETLGLPKEMAEFTYEAGRSARVDVRQDGKPICVIGYGPQYYGWRQSIRGGAFGVRESEVIHFGGEFDLRFGLTRANIDIPEESPVAGWGLDRPLLTFCGTDGILTVGTNVEIISRL